MSAIDDDDKIRVLWKQSRGVVDIHKENLYTDTSERPFVRQTLNKEVFSDEVPESLGTVPPTWNAPNYNNSLPDYSVENLDASFNSLFTLTGNTAYARGTIHNLAVIGYPQLDYYHRHQFIPFSTANLLTNGNSTTWYIPDQSDPNLSLARNTISFNKGGRGDYQYKFRITSTTSAFDFGVQELEEPYKFVFDNQSGFVLMYGDDDSPSPPINWALNASSSPLYGSFIKYVGSKGASGGGGGSFQGGLDASFNNVDISNNLNIIHDDLQTGILQSLKINHITNQSVTNTNGRDSIIIAKVEDAYDTLLNATGYFTLELVDGQPEGEYHTKIHFLAGITTKEGSNTDASKGGGSTGGSIGSSSVIQNDPLSSQINQSTLSNILDPINIGIIKNPILDPGIIKVPITIDPIDPLTTIYLVTVETINGSNKFLIDGEVRPVLNFVVGNTYIFDQSDPSNLGHQLQITEEQQHGIPVGYSITIGDPGKNDSKVTITIPDIKNKVLYYLCLPHGKNMGNQINVSDEITTLPIVEPGPPGPILGPGVIEEGGNNQVTTLTSATTTNIEYNGFIKVLSCLRQYHNAGNHDIGIQYINLIYDTNANICYLTIDTNHTQTITNLTFNIRLYKNSLNIMGENNKLQWTLDYIQSQPSFSLIKSIYIGSDPDPNLSGTIVYPYHPQEPFTATTQYSVVDNSMNVYGNLNIKGDINCDSSLNLGENINMSVEKKIVNPNYGIFEEKYYNNSNFGSRTLEPGTGGLWFTIARTNISTDAKTRTASAIFEIIDKSNTKANVANKPNGNIDPGFFDEYILVSVSWYYDTYAGQGNFHLPDPSTSKIQPPICSINVLNSRCGNNYNPYPVSNQQALGILSGIRVQTAFLDNNGSPGQAIAHLQLQRICSGTFAGSPVAKGFTDLKVRMFGNEKSNDALFWELESTDHLMNTIISNRFNTEFNLEKNVTGLVSDSNIPKNTIQYRDGIIMDSNEKVTIKSIDELNISCDDKIKLLVDDNTSYTNKILLGNKNDINDTHSISFFGGNTDSTAGALQSAILNLNGGSSGDQVKTGGLYYQDSNGNAGVGDALLNNVYTKGHYTDELCNPALVQPITIDLTTDGLNVSDNDWITLAVVGKADEVSRRASALFELTERIGGHHHSIVFRAGFCYSSVSADEYTNQEFNYIDIISNVFYTNNRFKQLRIKYNSSNGTSNGKTFGGGVLQVQISGTAGEGTQSPTDIYLKIYQNTKENGWISNSSIIQKYGNNVSIPVYDTTYNNNGSSETYGLEKRVSLAERNHVTTTQKKTFKFCGSGITVTNTEKFYLDTIEDSDSGWPAGPRSGSETQIKLDRRGINMNESTITNLWEIPSSWIPHITQQSINGNTVFDSNPDKVGGTASINSVRRRGVAVSLKTLQDFYQQMAQPFHLYKGGETKIQQSLSKNTLTDAYNFSDGFLAMLSEEEPNDSKNNAIVYRNAFMNGVYNVGTSNMNLEWRTKFSWTSTNLSQTLSTPYSVGLTGLDKFNTPGAQSNGSAGWVWNSSSTSQTNFFRTGPSPFSSTPELNYVEFTGKLGSNLGDYSVFTNDSLFVAGEGRGFDLFGTQNKWHIMPQRNTSAYVISAYLYLKHITGSSFSIDFGGQPYLASSQVQFILCGVTFSTSSSGGNTIRELTSLATITNTGSNTNSTVPSWTRLHDTGSDIENNNWIKWYPNNGNGEFSKGIYIGRTADQVIDNQTGSDRRFDALSIRVKVKVKNSIPQSLPANPPTVRIYGGPARLGFHISPLIRSVP